MWNALMNWIHIFCVAFALMLRIQASVEAANAPDTLEQFAMDIWEDSIEPKMMESGEVSNSDETNWQERSNLMKRVPNGFTGVRGKKNSFLDQNQLNEFNKNEDRKNDDALKYIYDIFRNDFFDDQHTKTLNIPYFLYRFPKTSIRKPYKWNSSKNYADEVDKRALKNAFMGVRGKKNSDRLFYKRAILNNRVESSERKRFEDFTNKFVAVRGKKSKNDVEQSLDISSEGSFKNYSKMSVNPN